MAIASAEKIKKLNRPLVSVIMPTYNYAQFIGEAVESVLRQTYTDLELIIIDNYSQDNTEEIIRSFKDERVRYYKFSNNGTIAKSRNYGIKNAKGEYIAFLDSDDTWLEDKLKTQLMYFMKDSDICLVSSSLKIKGPDKRYNNIVTFVDNGERLGHLHDELLDFNFISFSSVMVKASALDKVGYFDEGQNIVPAEDWDLWLRIAQVYKIAFIPKLVGIYRMHSSNSSMDVKKLDKALLVIDKHIGRGWINRTQADRARANLYFHEGWFVIDKDVRLARMLFLKAFNSSKRYKKIGYFSIFGLFLSLFPFLCRFIKKESLDKKIGSRILSLQHL